MQPVVWTSTCIVYRHSLSSSIFLIFAVLIELRYSANVNLANRFKLCSYFNDNIRTDCLSVWLDDLVC